MTDALTKVAELVERESGIVIKQSQMEMLVAALRRVSPPTTAEALLAGDDPVEHGLLLGRLVEQLVVQETFFLREPGELEAIDWHRLLAGAQRRGAGEINVWVAACASGEEAYSVALLATEAFGHGRPPVSILATDISTGALRRAERGVYSERSVRELSPERRDRFFVPAGKSSRVGDQLRSLVHLRRHNLVAEPAPPAGATPFDLILCRNVLIYFGADTAERVVGSLRSALHPGGDLILGAADRLTSSARRLGQIAAGTGTPGVMPRAAVSRPPRTPPANADQSIDPLDAEGDYLRGLSELANGDSQAAIEALRRALYLEPSFALAAFQLGRAHDLQGDEQAARRAYAQTLRALAGDTDRSRLLTRPGDVGEIAAACRARLARS